MTPDVLARAGKLILGEEWQRPLARLLGPKHPEGPRESLDPRLVQRWASGERPIPSWVAPVLAEYLQWRSRRFVEMAQDAEALAQELARYVPDPEIDADEDLAPGM